MEESKVQWRTSAERGRGERVLLKNQLFSQKKEAPMGAECECGAGRNVIEERY